MDLVIWWTSDTPLIQSNNAGDDKCLQGHGCTLVLCPEGTCQHRKYLLKIHKMVCTMERAALAGSHAVCLFSSTSPGKKPPIPLQAPLVTRTSLEIRRWTAEKKSGISQAETTSLPCTEAVVYRGLCAGTGKDVWIKGGN